jgi:WD40 repeat protein
VFEELGRGGTGVVYRARHHRLNRVVALKMILAGGHASAADLARFRTEAEAVARLQHPNVVQIYEVGDAAGLPYLSLEYCPGGTLAERLDGTPLPPRAAAGLVEALARAVHAAHEQGVVHRDLKPSNILLANSQAPNPKSQTEDRTGWDLGFGAWDFSPKVSDFGLAKQLDSDTGPTATNAILGTPSYMAPEQAAGRGKYVGPAADIYALGAILYELVTGHPPFRAATQLDTILQVANEEPVRPRRLQSRLPRDLETITLKCLEKDPAKRYATARDLADDLHRFLAAEPIRARPAGVVAAAGKWVRRHPAAAALLVAAAAGVVITVVGMAAVHARLQHERDLARQQEQAAATERDTARRHLYTSRINWARQALAAGQLERARDLLQTTARDAGDGAADPRGFEWHYLWRATRAGAFALRGHAGPVNGVAFAPGGRVLASASFDGTARLWDLPASTDRAVLTGHAGPVLCVAVSPDGRTLATGTDGTVRLWDADPPRQRAVLTGHAGRVTSVAISPDGETLATGGADGSVRLWDLPAGQERANLTGHRGGVQAVAFAPDGRTLAAGGADGAVRLWDAADGKPAATIPGRGDAVSCLAFSPDGKMLAAGSLWDKSILVWDAASRNLKYAIPGGRPPGHLGRVLCLAFSPDGRTLATGGGDRGAKLWDAATGRFRGNLPPHTGGVHALAFAPDGSALATAGGDDTVKLWDPATRQVWRAGSADAAARPVLRSPASGYRWCVRFSPDGRTVFAGAGTGGIPGVNGAVLAWDVRTGTLRPPLADPAGATVRAVAVSPDGREVAAGSQDGRTRVWDLATGRVRLTLDPQPKPISCVAYRPDGAVLAAACSDGTVTLWDTATGQARAVLRGHGPGSVFVAYSPDGRRLATASFDQTTKVWDADAGQEVLTLRGHTGWVTAAAFAPDGRTLATSGGVYDQTARLWDLSTGEARAVLKGHADAVNCLAFTPDGRTLATGGEDFTVRLWDPVTGLEWLALTDFAGPVLSVAFSPDGKTLAACGGLVNEVKLWEGGGGEP